MNFNPAWLAIKGGVALVPRWVWLALAAGLALAWWGGKREEAGRVAERAAQAKAQAIAVKSVLKQRDAAEAAERKQLAEIGTRLDKEKNDAIRDRDRTIADLRTGALRVHPRFQCPAGPRVLPEAAGSAAVGDGAGQGGLLGADAEFLVREAGRADAVTLQLQACQAVIRAERD